MNSDKKLNVVVLMGGASAEHDVSLASGKMILEALDKNKYKVKSVTISKDGKWFLPPASVKALPASGASAKDERSLATFDGGRAVERLKAKDKTDVVFIALHGTFGEDGKIQGLLELAGIPYTGSGVLASAIGMDKEMTKRIFRSEKIPTPRYFIFTKNNHVSMKKTKFPCVVKPVSQGSSVGVSIVQGPGGLKKAIKKAFAFGPKVIIEEFIEGREITAAVLGNKKPKALPLIEIKPRTSDFFDYKAKYEAGGSDEICPAPLPSAVVKKIQDLAIKIHLAFGCRGVTRTDFILSGARPYALEINTLPGMTKTSLVPQAAQAAGIKFSELMDKLIALAIEKE